MGKGKLEKFAEMETFDNVFQYPFAVISEQPFPLRGRWHSDYFHNTNPLSSSSDAERVNTLSVSHGCFPT